jgi:hypothetical protein
MTQQPWTCPHATDRWATAVAAVPPTGSRRCGTLTRLAWKSVGGVFPFRYEKLSEQLGGVMPSEPVHAVNG